MDEYDERIAQVKIDQEEANAAAGKYLRENRSLLNDNIAVFQDIAKNMYPDKRAGLIVHNNKGDNNVRFDVDAKIEADASDGINEVKIFTFDLTLLLTQHRHRMKCIFHDSRLYSDIDPRQRAEVFKTAYRKVTSRGYQYIATLNQDQIEGMRDEFTDDEYEAIIEKNINLSLTDASPEQKLLGIDVELEYQ